MSSRYRKKPLAQFEQGTRVYAPSAGESRYRVVGTDPTTGTRVFAKCSTEQAARQKAREFEDLISQGAPIPLPGEEGPRTVERLAASYVDHHLAGLSLRYR